MLSTRRPLRACGRGASSSSRRRAPVPALLPLLPRQQCAGAHRSAAPPPAAVPQEGRVQQAVQQVATSLLAAAVTASALLGGAAPPPALAHSGGGEHASHASAAALYGSAASAPPGTAAAQFSCQPVTWAERVQLFEPDLRSFGSHKIRTSSRRAQALFDQGLLLSYNFNGPEAARAFEAGISDDPAAPMLHWGLVHALAPYANKVWAAPPPGDAFPVMTQQELVRAKRAAQEGLAAAAANLAASPDDPLAAAEHAYLSAADRLFGRIDTAGDPAFKNSLKRYAEDLEAIAAAYPTDADAPALAAAARMNLRPWEHWTGPLTLRTPVEAESVVLPALRDINTTLERRPGHPMATHLLIHLAEAATPGSTPAAFGFAALAEGAADALAGSDLPHQDHLIHMPSHIYLRVGRWHDAVAANTRALDVEEQLAQRCIEPYMPEHNASMLQYAAMMSGELAEARRTAARQADFPRLFGPTNMPDGRERAALPMLLARFGRWPELLALSRADLDYSRDGLAMLPPGTEAYNDGLFHYVRLLALASAAAHEPDAGARGALLSQVGAEFDGLAAAVAATPPDPLTQPGDGIGIYSPGFNVLGRIEMRVAEARRAALQQDADWDAAAAALEDALALDGAVGYTEPPRQYQPLRQCLGWVRLQAGQLDAAEQVYRDDLAELPANPWSLKGLQQVYAARAGGGADTEQQLAAVDAALAAAWAHADPGLPLPSSCPAFSD